MITVTIQENDKDQRLDRFLRKYFNRAPLSQIYKMIRKDVKINGKRGKEDTMLAAGDVLSIYLSDEDVRAYRKVFRAPKAKKQFKVVYEDENVLIADKPFGLLTHGDSHEKKNTLVNQVTDYLIGKGEYEPGKQQTFRPACVNRLDRNTTGLVIFGKNAKAVRELARLISDKDAVEKNYVTIVSGKIDEPCELKGEMVKDESENRALIMESDTDDDTKTMSSIVTPLAYARGYTLVQVRILTGRTHQIRVQLAHMGHPIIGDPKYGNKRTNDTVRREFGLDTQLLHCRELVFKAGPLEGKTIVSDPPERFRRIQRKLFKEIRYE